MIIDYKKEKPSAYPNFKGGEGVMNACMFFDERNRILSARLEPGATIGLHRHETSSEIMFFLSGTGKAVIEGVEEPVSAGTCHYCPKGAQHTLINTGSEDLCFYAVVPEQ